MKFVLPRSLWRGASSKKVSKNPKIYCIHSSLPKNAKSRFGFLGLLGVKIPLFQDVPDVVEVQGKKWKEL
jgi:hypothetical protein